jgi:hypothetical protein
MYIEQCAVLGSWITPVLVKVEVQAKQNTWHKETTIRSVDPISPSDNKCRLNVPVKF